MDFWVLEEYAPGSALQIIPSNHLANYVFMHIYILCVITV